MSLKGVSNYLARVAERATGGESAIRPRLPSLFEPYSGLTKPFGVSLSIDESRVPQFDVEESKTLPDEAPAPDDRHISRGPMRLQPADSAVRPVDMPVSQQAPTDRAMPDQPSRRTSDEAFEGTVRRAQGSSAARRAELNPPRATQVVERAGSREVSPLQSRGQRFPRGEQSIDVRPAIAESADQRSSSTRQPIANSATPQAKPPQHPERFALLPMAHLSHRPDTIGTQRNSDSTPERPKSRRESSEPAIPIPEQRRGALTPLSREERTVIQTLGRSREPTRTVSAGDRAEANTEPVINVTIGRIEVRVVAESSVRTLAKPDTRAHKPMSLDEYLKQRGAKR